MQLSRRELAVLREVVRLHIAGGEPVSSRQVARQSGLGLSPATLRNVMSDLEEAGWLVRPHPSAGCVPSDQSLRLYVDAGARGGMLPKSVQRRLSARIEATRRELVEDMEWVARLVAEVTREAGVAVRPLGEDQRLEAVSLVSLGGERVLAVVITSVGAVERRVLELDEEFDDAQLQEVANLLNRRYHGVSLRDATAELEAVLAGDVVADETGRVLRCAAKVGDGLFRCSAGGVEVLVAGAENLLQSADFTEVGRVRSLVSALQDRGRIAGELQRLLDDERARVVIGGESEVTAAANLGMVAALFFHEGERVGAVGVVGPRRMDYLKIVPMVEFIGDTLTKMLDESGANHV